MKTGAIEKTWNSFPGFGKFIIVGVGSFGVYKLVKNLLKDKPPQVTLPNGGQGLVAGTDSSGNVVLWSGLPLATKLYKGMKGFNFVSPVEEWRQLAELPTDDMVADVYNKFNQLNGDESLTVAIKDEWSSFEGKVQKERALLRLNRLNLI